jgi:hypothetical protein
MIILYQVGLFPVYYSLQGVDGKGVKVSSGVSWENPKNEHSGVEGSVSLLPATSPLVKSSSFKVTGSLLNTHYNKMTAGYNYLKSIAGRRNIKLIAMQIEDKSVEDGPEVFASGDITWLVCDAILTDIKTDSTWAGSTITTTNVPVTLTFDIRGYWQPLSPLYWEYRPYDTIVGRDEIVPLTSNTFLHPVTFDDLTETGTFYRWPSSLSDYSPTMWGQKYDGQIGGNGSDFAPFGLTSLFVDPYVWQNTNSLYAFTGLTATDEISIKATMKTGEFKTDLVEEESTLDLSTVDDDLALIGYYGLRSTDIIYTGMVDPLPGYVVRDGVRIPDLAVRWQYNLSYPGEVVNGDIEIDFTGSLGNVAYLHDYLVY